MEVKIKREYHSIQFVLVLFDFISILWEENNLHLSGIF